MRTLLLFLACFPSRSHLISAVRELIALHKLISKLFFLLPLLLLFLLLLSVFCLQWQPLWKIVCSLSGDSSFSLYVCYVCIFIVYLLLRILCIKFELFDLYEVCYRYLICILCRSKIFENILIIWWYVGLNLLRLLKKCLIHTIIGSSLKVFNANKTLILYLFILSLINKFIIFSVQFILLQFYFNYFPQFQIDFKFLILF